MTKTKQFRLFDAVLAAVCVVLVVESAAPAAAIGNSQFFWWALLLVGFFLPYGLISAELGTTYEDEGGIYDWVKRAYGKKWGSRVAWYYYINFPLWMGSLAVLFTDILIQITGWEIPTIWLLVIQLAYIWLVVGVSFFRVSDSKWILNIAAFFKAFLMLVLGGLGIYVALTRGVANEFTVSSLFPSFDVSSLSFIAVILFNFMGFEVVTTFASEMKNPGREIPKAIIIGGILIAAFYLLAAFGISVAVPVEELSTSDGLIESFGLLIGTTTGPLILLFGLMFLYTIVANPISWSLGVNYVAQYAAKEGSLPKVFRSERKDNQMPLGANIMNGVIASAMVVAAPLIPSEDLFWSFFSLNMITLLLSYVLMFPAFLKLRRIDGDIERPFQINVNGFWLKMMVWVPLILLVVSLIFSAVPLNTTAEELNFKLPILIGTIVAVIIGEIIAAWAVRNDKHERSSE
ncbi:MAG TPA: APC family permease [Firmicutes bacterium]|nr:APC family permease [Bacillota bacterium]